MVVRILWVLASIGDELCQSFALANKFDQFWSSCTTHVHATFLFKKKVFDGAAVLLTENLVDFASRDIAHVVSIRKYSIKTSSNFGVLIIISMNYLAVKFKFTVRT